MNSKRYAFITALVLAVLLFQFAPLGSAGNAAAASRCNAATFIADVTVPDGSIFNAGAAFVKTWRLKNSGTCTWTSAYSAAFDSGDPLGAASSIPLPASVAPGKTVDVSVNLTAPAASGHYRGNWMLKNAAGVKFGLGTAADKPFWVDIKVASPPTATPTQAPDETGIIFQGTVRRNGAGVPGVRIYYGDHYPGPGGGAIEYGYGTLIATTGADGKYKKFVPISGDYASMTVWAELQGYGFDPVIHSWYHAAGLETRSLDFTAAPGNPGTFPNGGAAYDFGYRALEAVWTSGAGALPYPGVEGDARGFVRQSNQTTFEDGTVDLIGPNLVVAPQNVYNGYIQGVYPEYTVHTGDRFRASVGCAYGFSCYVTFRLDYRVNNGPTRTFWAWQEKNEGQVYYLDRDISSLAGQKVSFILSLLATGPATGDRAIWGHPRIVQTGGTLWTATPTPTPTSTMVTPVSTTVMPTSTTTVTPTSTGVTPISTTVTPTSTATPTLTLTPVTTTVVPPTPGPGTILDFVSSACVASWASAVSWLPSCPGADQNEYGYVLQVRNSQYENGAWEVAPGLILSPQKIYDGYVQGTYPEVAIQAGDRFQGIVGCAYGYSCYVTFELDYQVGNGPVTRFWTWMEKNEGQNHQVDKDLSALAGKNVKFILKVLATGPATNDRALWSQPRIVRPGAAISPTPTPTSTIAPYIVTGATANVVPLNSQAYCGGPNPVDVSGTITTNGPTTVTFHWEMRGDSNNTTSDESLIFTEAGTLTVREGAYKVDCGNYSARLVITSPNNLDAITYYSILASTETPSPTPSPTPTPTATVTPQGNVSNVTVAVNVPEFVNCAVIMTVGSVGTITTDGPATVIYHWETGSTTPQIGPDTTLVFSSASTQSTQNYPFSTGCGDHFARLVVTSPNAISAQANFSPIKPTVLPIYDFSAFHTVIGTLACGEVASYTWSAETGNGESGGYMVSRQTPLFGKSYAGFLRVDGNSICNLGLP